MLPRRKARVVEVEAEVPEKFMLGNVAAEVAGMLDYSTYEPKTRHWLDLGSKEANDVFGSRKLGMPYGKMYELSGMQHGGKTALTTIIAGLAQQDGAAIGRIDVEDSRDALWESKLGLDSDNVLTFYPKLILPKGVTDVKEKGKKRIVPRLQSAEDLFVQAENGMARFAAKGATKQFWYVDSIANLIVQKAVDAGTDGQNMSTRAGGKSVFLSEVLPRWCGLASSYNATIFLLNQLRTKPGVMFGDPTYTPGGRALLHNCHVINRVARIKGGELKHKGRVIGIVGGIKNKKNKAGGGSRQGGSCGYRILWNTNPAKVEFMSFEEAEELLRA